MLLGFVGETVREWLPTGHCAWLWVALRFDLGLLLGPYLSQKIELQLGLYGPQTHQGENNKK